MWFKIYNTNKKTKKCKKCKTRNKHYTSEEILQNLKKQGMEICTYVLCHKF
jgi:arginine repressor